MSWIGNQLPSHSTPATTTAVAGATAPPPIAPTPEVETPPTPAELGQLLSAYVAQVNVKLQVCGFVIQTFAGRIKQDEAYAALESARTDAEDMKDKVQEEQAELNVIEYGASLEDADADVFDSVREAANAIAADEEAIAVDIAVAANFGQADDEIPKLLAGIPKKRKVYEAAVRAGYRHYGYTVSDMDPKTLLLKPVEKPAPVFKMEPETKI